MTSLLFSTIDVTRQAFYRTAFTYAIVNLKPIVPGHVLVVPTRPVRRIADLTPSELTSLMVSVQRVGEVIERAYGADGLTIACQDGKAAGQTVPHVHFHLLPRHLQGDRFSENNDTIYPELEQSEQGLSQHLRAADAQARARKQGDAECEGPVVDEHPLQLKVDADEDREPRSMEEMMAEAEWLKAFFTTEEGGKAAASER